MKTTILALSLGVFCLSVYGCGDDPSSNNAPAAGGSGEGASGGQGATGNGEGGGSNDSSGGMTSDSSGGMASDSSGGAATGGATDASGGAGGAGGAASATEMRCHEGCIATLDADCEHGPTDQQQCEDDCNDLVAGSCGDEYTALQDCAEGEEVTCGVSGFPIVEACSDEQLAFYDCMN